MKVLQVLPELNSGGVERGTLEFADYLIQKGHQSFVLSNGGRLVPELTASGSKHIQLSVHKKSLFSLRHIFRVKRLLETENFDIVHLRSRMPAWIVYLAWNLISKSKRPKLVTTVHGFYSVNPYSAIMTKGETIICVSKSVKKYVLKNYPSAKNKKIKVIYRGVDTNHYHSNYKPSDEWLAKWNRQNKHLKNQFILTLPGRISAWKGQEDFMEIIRFLKHRKLPIHGLVVGDVHPNKKSYYRILKKKLYHLKLNKNITFLGHRKDIHQIMYCSDLIISCSKDPEAFGRVTLEALSIGKPVFAYAHGGVREQLTELLPEGMIKPDKLSSMKTKLAHYIESEKSLKPKENKRFTLKVMNAKILKVYESLLH